MDEKKKNLCAMIPESLHIKGARGTGATGTDTERVRREDHQGTF